ncbi:hypothetical protein GCM10009660_21780 [Catellatospora bangladeshensis]
MSARNTTRDEGGHVLRPGTPQRPSRRPARIAEIGTEWNNGPPIAAVPEPATTR